MALVAGWAHCDQRVLKREGEVTTEAETEATHSQGKNCGASRNWTRQEILPWSL